MRCQREFDLTKKKLKGGKKEKGFAKLRGKPLKRHLGRGKYCFPQENKFYQIKKKKKFATGIGGQNNNRKKNLGGGKKGAASKDHLQLTDAFH